MTPKKPSHPYLAGNFAPIHSTHASTQCSFTGTIPKELLGGQYVRNGGNPITDQDLARDAHWFDGDGMLTGVHFVRSPSNPGEALPFFTNQYILTDLCIFAHQNRNLRTPLLPSIATLVDPASSLFTILFRLLRAVFLIFVSHLQRPGKIRVKRNSVANTGIHFHDGRALASCESGPPMRISLPGLETVGWFDGANCEGELQSNGEKKEDTFRGTGLLGFMREWTTGHPKVDPVTGEMVLFHSSFKPPYVHYSVLPQNRAATAERLPKLLVVPVPGVSGSKLMHDFGVAREHTVILDLPLTLSAFNMMKRQPVLYYDCDKPARFGVFPRRQPEKVRWFETAGCCIFHIANTWDERDANGNIQAVKMLACRQTSASVVFNTGNITIPEMPRSRGRRLQNLARRGSDEEEGTPDDKTPLLDSSTRSSAGDTEQCRLYYYRFSLDRPGDVITHQYALTRVPFEFPTLNPAYDMSAARYIYGCSTTEDTFGTALGKATKIDVLLKVDVTTLMERGAAYPPRSVTGCVDMRSMAELFASKDQQDPIRTFLLAPHHFAQEARFVSRENPVAEDDGYLLFYVFDERQLDGKGECLPNAMSELWILDARNMKDVVVRVRLPQRVPYGLHGNWFSEEQIQTQRDIEGFRSLPVDPEKGVMARLRSLLVGAVG
ncbi:carotenoid oxygenase [Sporormia fimetaria CBS 119925]|uniref:Carotenoid oxygenase n=1 Tax=Sporormia fimetaria CBS 119925 TaxID=1340428 RepID=A0A6A6UXR2_9PLEO|nr:carotenoid oxygenase [Sporormia fimetaria CBS 119925]